jgi:iron complex transport system permease protein
MIPNSKKPARGLQNRHISSTVIHIFLLMLGLSAVIIVSTGMGYIKIPLDAVVKIILTKISGQSSLIEGVDNLFPVVVIDVRLPRILSAAIVGGGLAISGVVFQGILLNPLADPYTLGVSAGAAFGASLALLLNIGLLGSYSVPLFAFIGAIVTLLFVIYLSSSSGGVSSNNLILSGIIVAAILSAGISFLKYIADEQVAVIIFWLMGSFASKTWMDVSLTSLLVGIGFCVFIFYARDLNLMFGRGYQKGHHNLAGHGLTCSCNLCFCVRNHRFRRPAGSPHDEADHRSGQPSTGACIASGRCYFAFGG